MAKSSKSRRGQRKESGEPEAPDGREEQSPEAGTERLPGEEEAGASPEAPLHDEDARDSARGDLTAAAAHDEPAVADAAAEPGVAPDEPQRAETEPEHAEPEHAESEYARAEHAEAQQAESGRRSSRTWIAGGLIVLLAVAAIASAWIYGTYGEGQVGWVTAGRLDAVSQRVDELAGQVEAQADQVGATGQTIDGVRAETSQLADRMSAVETTLQDLRSTIEANSQRLDELAGRLEQLQSAGGEPGDGSGAAVGELQGTVEALASRVQELEQGQDLGALTQTIARLEQEIGDLRSQAEAQSEQAQQVGALSRAYAALSERVAAGEPFAEPLETVAAQLPGAPGLDVLQPLAADGVATVAELQSELARIAESYNGGAGEPGDAEAGGDDLWASLRQRLEGAVTIRRAGEADWASVLARAEEALQAGDIDTAVMEVEQASDDPPPEIEAWLAQATRTRDAEVALDELSAVVLRQLAGQG